MRIRKLLIANRGEIARRIIRTCRKMGIQTVALYSEADRFYPFVREADEAYPLGGSTAPETYLNIPKILDLAQRARVDAIHPGYGFLAENAEFARAVTGAGLIFVGPHADAIAAMGSKAEAKALAQSVGVPTVPGFQEPGATLEEFQAAAERLGFPVLLKAAAGGGGKGMRIVETPEAFAEAFLAAQREAEYAFGSRELLLEKYFPAARHIEIQILGDKHGNLIHLRERECTIQRRYQKIVEESPSPVLSPAEREEMGEMALRLARALRYDNAGTVEFLYAGPRTFYFLEVNTRLQVEHPVTEMILGLDLVEWQIRVAQGEPLTLQPEALQPQGYAIEVRLYAEDPERDFAPSTGVVRLWQVPELPYLRVEAAVESGTAISPYYDAMIAKLIAHGPTRAEGLQRLRYALSRVVCLGIQHNLPLLQALLEEPDFLEGRYTTHFLAERPHLLAARRFTEAERTACVVGLTLWRLRQEASSRALLPTFPLNWRNTPQAPLPYGWLLQGEIHTVGVAALEGPVFRCRGKDWEGTAYLLERTDHYLTYEWDQRRWTLYVASAAEEEQYWVHLMAVGSTQAKLLPRFPDVGTELKAGTYQAPMPGQVLKVLVQPGDTVKPGQTLLLFVSMKMEQRIQAQEAGTVEAVYVREGEQVEAGRELLRLVPEQG
ncbi:MAG: biotin carboxylase N-terminal domain-containing protein [Bacteroidia bacterium]